MTCSSLNSFEPGFCPANEATTAEADIGHKSFLAEEQNLAGVVFDGTVFSPMPNHFAEPYLTLPD